MLSGILRLVELNAAIYKVYYGASNQNALRLNEIFRTDLMYIAALTSTQLGLFERIL